MGKEKSKYQKWGNYFGGKMKSHLQSANEKSFYWIWIWIWQMMWLIDKFFEQNLFNQFLLNQINPVNIISYKFAGNDTILKSCYSFRKFFSFRKAVIFLTDTFFWKVIIFSKRCHFLIKTAQNIFLWADTFLTENGYKQKSFHFFEH